MKQERKHTIAVTDRPIERPICDIPDEFIRNIESRLVTKRQVRRGEDQDRRNRDN